jgi:hypothetical protein
MEVITNFEERKLYPEKIAAFVMPCRRQAENRKKNRPKAVFFENYKALEDLTNSKRQGKLCPL